MVECLDVEVGIFAIVVVVCKPRNGFQGCFEIELREGFRYFLQKRLQRLLLVRKRAVSQVLCERGSDKRTRHQGEMFVDMEPGLVGV